MRLKYLSIVLAMFLSASLCSQGTLLYKGVSGLSIGSDYISGQNISNFGGNLGYSLNGMVDLGIALRREVIENGISENDLNSLSISPSISFIQHSSQFLMAINLSYRHDNINSDAFDSLGLEASGDYYSVGASVKTRFFAGDYFFVQPMFNAWYIAGREKAHNPSTADYELHTSQMSIYNPIYQEIPAGETRSDFAQKINWGFGADFCFETSANIILHLTPNIRFDDGDAFVGIRGGFVLRTGRQLRSKPHSIQGRHRFVRLAISRVLKKHFLLYQTEQTPMKEGESFDIVRRDKSEWMKIGTARVVRVQGSKVVLEYQLDNKYDLVTTDDKLVYRY